MVQSVCLVVELQLLTWHHLMMGMMATLGGVQSAAGRRLINSHSSDTEDGEEYFSGVHDYSICDPVGPRARNKTIKYNAALCYMDKVELCN